MDVSQLLSDLPSAAISWEIYPNASAPDAFGEVDHGTPSVVADTVVTHPKATRRALERLSESDKRRELRSFYTARTDVTSGGGLSAPSVAQLAGERYEVLDVGVYDAVGAGLRLITAALLD